MADQFGEQQPAAFLTLDILVGKRAQIGFARLLKVVETSKSLPLHQCDWMCAWCREGLPLLSPWQFEKRVAAHLEEQHPKRRNMSAAEPNKSLPLHNPAARSETPERSYEVLRGACAAVEV